MLEQVSELIRHGVRRGPAIGLAISGSMFLGCADSASPTVVPTQSYGPELSQPMSDKLRRGRLLEVLDFRTLSNGTRLPADQFYSVDGKLFLWNLSFEKEIVFHEQRLNNLTGFCELDKIPVAFVAIFTDEIVGGGEASAAPSPDGKAVQVLLGWEAHRQLAKKDLDEKYEVAPEKRGRALDNLTNIKLNTTLIKLLCTSAGAERLHRQGASRQQAERFMESMDSRFKGYEDQILNQAVLPIVLVRSITGI